MQQPLSFRALNDVFWYTTKALLSVTTQYATSKEASKPLTVSGGREEVPNSSKMMPSNITV
jgi:hypothetical protein